jgi:adenylate cyclase
MGKEIERKFLVKGEFKSQSVRKYEITQAYLSVDPERIVRLRITGDNAYITIKSRAVKGSIARDEWEFSLAVSDAYEIMKICLPGRIQKTRYFVPFKGYNFEVDVFHGRNDGLVIAEIELNDENEKPVLPDWIGDEVTGKPEYYNSNLI